MRAGLIAVAVLFVAGCGMSNEVIPLLQTAGVPLTQPTQAPLRVVTRATAVNDPLPLRGADTTYSDVETALGYAISSATVPWANEHKNHPSSRDGWQLFVEITNADAKYDDGRVIFSLAVRATLHARAGNVYLAQTQASCRQGGVAAPDKGGPVMYKCMMEIGRDLNGWLEGVDLNAVATTR